MPERAGFRGLLEVCWVALAGRGLCCNVQRPTLIFDSATTVADTPNCLEFDSRVGEWEEQGYDVAYNHLVFEGVV